MKTFFAAIALALELTSATLIGEEYSRVAGNAAYDVGKYPDPITKQPASLWLLTGALLRQKLS